MATNVIMITDRTDKTDICIGQLLQSLRCFVCNGALQCVPLFRLQYIFFSFATGSQKISLVLQWAERVSSMHLSPILPLVSFSREGIWVPEVRHTIYSMESLGRF